MARTGSGRILGDETDSVGALSGGLATETDSVGIPASGGIATETDIMGRPAPGRSLYTEYTVYRYTHILIGYEPGLIALSITISIPETIPPYFQPHRQASPSQTSTTMSSTDSTSKHDYHVTSLGSFKRLNSTNYIQWRINARTMLDTMNAWKIVTGEEKMPTETPPAHSMRAKSGETDASTSASH